MIKPHQKQAASSAQMKGATTAMKAPASVDKQTRIPSALQVVFLASNRGTEVHQPPPDRMADKVYVQNWKLQQQGGAGLPRRASFSNLEDAAGKPPTMIRNDSMPKLSRRRRKKKQTGPESEISPQTRLDEILTERGYSTETYETLKTAYYNKPSAYQKASYGSKMVEIVRRGDLEGMQKMMDMGLSPNPCNVYGESLVHMVCRRGDVELLEILVEAGVNLRVSDDYGRTPLHDACWTADPAFDVMDLLLKCDPRLLYMKDARGSLPFSYLHKEHWDVIKLWIEDMKDTYWPNLAIGDEEGAPALAMMEPNSMPLPDPKNALPRSMAVMLSNGRMTAEEIKTLLGDGGSDLSGTHEESESEESDSDSDYSSGSDYYSDSEASGISF